MMIRATELNGRPVVDLDAAEKLGRVDKIVIDPDGRRLAALLVSRGPSLLGSDAHATVAAASVHAIGPDAITVRNVATSGAAHDVGRLPRVSDVIGRKVVSRDGRLLGVIGDVLLDGADGRITGYLLAETSVVARLDHVLGGRKPRRGRYVRADADLRAGKDLVVVPDDAITDWEEERPAAAAQAAVGGAASEPPPPPTRTAWVRDEAPERRMEPRTPAW